MGRWITPASDGAGAFVCYTVKLPNDVGFAAVLFGALSDMARPWFWDSEAGGISPDAAAAAFQATFDFARESRGCVIGTIFAHALANPPTGSLACDGAVYLIADYPDLAAVLDSVYSVPPASFRVPDLRSRSIVGVGQGSGLTNRVLDAAGGEEAHQVTVGEMPSHGHTVEHVTALPAGLPGEPTFVIAAITAVPSGSTGGDGAHNTMHPFRAIHYAIWAR